MKKYKAIATLALMGAALVSLAGCQEKEGMSRGRAVSFKVSSGNHETKASYSGTVTSGAERIDWANGDPIRIYCAAAKYGIANSNSAPTLGSDQDQKFADYTVSGVAADGKLSNAKINSVNGNGGKELLWGDNVQHDFYAVYPKPAAGGIVTDITGKKVTGTVNAAQNGDGRFSDGMVMVAHESIASPQGLTSSFKDEVFLKFSPITTAIKFSITNGETSNITVSKVELVSDIHPLSGEFVYNIGEGKVRDASVTAAEKKVTITPSPAKLLTANNANTYDFTFLLRPDDNLDDLKIVVTTSTGIEYASELKIDGSAHTFNAGTKTSITGVILKKWLTLESITFLTADIREDTEVEEEILF